jgi:hypothetical protein
MAMKRQHSSDWFGMLLGFLTFVSGICLLLFTFKLAFELFSVPPEQAVGIAKDKAVDFAQAGQSLVAVLVRIVLLLVMAGVGSMIANRGIKLYVSARAMVMPTSEPQPEKTESEA